MNTEPTCHYFEIPDYFRQIQKQKHQNIPFFCGALNPLHIRMDNTVANHNIRPDIAH